MKETSFVQEVENRFNALFAIEEDSADRSGDSAPEHVNARKILEAITAEPAAVARPDISATAVLSIDDQLKDMAEATLPIRPGSYHFLLAENEKNTSTDSCVADHPSLDEIASIVEPPEPGADGKERFENIFGDITSSTPALLSPVKNLKSILLSLEWEISDVLLDKLDTELGKLQDLYRNDRTVLIFLRMLQFLERHIKSKQGDTSIESVKLLFSVYDNLERIILSKTITDDMKRDILAATTGEYKNWVEKHIDFSGRSGANAEWDIAPAVAIPQSPVSATLPYEPIARALVEFKKTIRTEFAALRMEFQMVVAKKTQTQARTN